MKVTLSDGRELLVSFMYERDYGETTAILKFGEMEIKQNAWVSSKDQYKRKIGRKIALARVLQRIFPSTDMKIVDSSKVPVDMISYEDKLNNKKWRTEIWSALFKRGMHKC